MVESNVRIIEELKYFLEAVSKDVSLRKLVTETEKDFTRERKLPMERIVGLIINMPKRSLSIEIQEFYECLGKDLVHCTKGAFCSQRSKLKALIFEAWNQWLVRNFYHYYGDHVKRWHNFRVQAVDGSTAYLINKKEVVDYFGTQDNQHVCIPMARIMQVQDILNDITVWGKLFLIKESEQVILAGQVSHLYADSLTLFDRGYPSYALIYLINNQEVPRHFVIRCKVGFNKEMKQFLKSSKNSKIIDLKPTANAIATLREHGHIITVETTTKVRMVKVFLSSGEEEILLTNLYDQNLYTNEDLKYLYGLRWGIETTYGKQKNQLQMEQFSGHRVICIQQDYAAGLLVANLQSLIEKQCEDYLDQVNQKRIHQYKINRNVSWASLKHNIVKLSMDKNPEQILLQLQKAFERNIEPVRAGRQNPRKKKVKRLNGKYQTLRVMY